MDSARSLNQQGKRRALRVVHLSIADDTGGAARSAYKIHSGLRELGLESHMLVAHKSTQDGDVVPFRGLGGRLIDWPFRQFNEALGLQYLLTPSSLSLLSHPLVRAADIVQVYNTHGNYLSHLILGPLSQRKKVVWRLSDMWSFTGHCSFSFDCERWESGCGHCPYPNVYPSVQRDMTAGNWRIKQWLYGHAQLTLVAPSHWLERLVHRSPLVSRFACGWIPNGVDLRTFHPTDKLIARKALGLPLDGLLVMASSTEARKGGQVLPAVLQKLRQMNAPDFELVMLGNPPSSLDSSGYRTRKLGHISDDAQLSLAYSASDALLFPALADNLPNVVLESMACGTPAVAFDVGGVSDAVRHLETGYLAGANRTDELAAGLLRLLTDEPLRLRLGQQDRQVAEEEYSLELQAKRFASLYDTLRPW